MNDLKRKAASGLFFKFAERVGAQGINFIIQILLARILMPDDYGLIALVVVFITVCDVFVTYGFGNSLIVNKKSDHLDFSTCFYFGLALSVVVYAIVFYSAPFIASFYSKPLLTPVIRVMGIRIPIASVNSVQHAYVSKNMWFRKFFFATLIGTIISGVVAVIMAYQGFGVWAMVEQNLGNVIIDTICLWIIVGWRPKAEFSFNRLKVIYDYGWKVLGVGLIDTLYTQLRDLIIGKKYTSADLAYYNRGYRFPSFAMRLIEPTVNTVLFPTLSQCKENQAEMRSITRRLVKISTFIVSPVMVGLAVVAEPMVLVLLTNKWLPCVLFLRIGCIANLFRPNQFINNSVIAASGRSDLLLKLNILKKSLGVGILIASMAFGLTGIAVSQIIIYFLSMVINIAPNRKILGYGYLQQTKDFVANLLPALVMGVVVYPISKIDLAPLAVLFLQIVAGVFVYVVISLLFRNESFFYLLNIAKQHLHKSKTKAESES